MDMLRFEHINLTCQNLEATQEFYQTLFPDWYVRAEGVNDDGSRWMHFGNNQFYLALSDHPNAERVHKLYEHIGINHVGFVIKDSEAMKKLLASVGISYYTFISPETKLRIYVEDPDGNEIELVEYQPEYALR